MLLAVDVGPPVLLECLKGSVSLLVNGGRGMATSIAYGSYAEPVGLAALAKNCLMCRAADGQS
jgi:hypothetical protein